MVKELKHCYLNHEKRALSNYPNHIKNKNILPIILKPKLDFWLVHNYANIFSKLVWPGSFINLIVSFVEFYVCQYLSFAARVLLQKTFFSLFTLIWRQILIIILVIISLTIPISLMVCFTKLKNCWYLSPSFFIKQINW